MEAERRAGEIAVTRGGDEDARAGSWARVAVAGLGVLSLAGYAGGVAGVAAAGARAALLYVPLVAALFVLYVVAVWIALRAPSADRFLIGLVLGFGLAFRLVLLPTPVILSSDVYRYLWDGRVQWAGVNPYRYAPAAPELQALRDPVVHPWINRPSKRTVYPPGAELLFATVASVAPKSLLGWRLVVLGGEVATGLLLLDLLRRMNVPAAAVVVYAWAPLAVLEGVQAGHLEFALLPVILLALRFRQAGQMARAGLVLGAAILLKLYPAVLVVAWWRRRDWRLPVACLAVVAAGYLWYLPGAGARVLGFLPEYFGSAEDFNIGLRYFLTGWIPFESALVREAVRGVTMVILASVLAVVLWRVARAHDESLTGIFEAGWAAVSAYVLLIPTAMHPWYAAWLLPFLVVRPSPGWLWFTGAVSLSYLRYVAPSGEVPLWALGLEYLPLYGLLIWEWRRGIDAVELGAAAAWWKGRVAPRAP